MCPISCLARKHIDHDVNILLLPTVPSILHEDKGYHIHLYSAHSNPKRLVYKVLNKLAYSLCVTKSESVKFHDIYLAT